MAISIARPLRVCITLNLEKAIFAQAAVTKAVADEHLELGSGSSREQHEHVADLALAAEIMGQILQAWRRLAIEGEQDEWYSLVTPIPLNDLERMHAALVDGGDASLKMVRTRIEAALEDARTLRMPEDEGAREDASRPAVLRLVTTPPPAR